MCRSRCHGADASARQPGGSPATPPSWMTRSAFSDLDRGRGRRAPSSRPAWSLIEPCTRSRVRPGASRRMPAPLHVRARGRGPRTRSRTVRLVAACHDERPCRRRHAVGEDRWLGPAPSMTRITLGGMMVAHSKYSPGARWMVSPVGDGGGCFAAVRVLNSPPAPTVRVRAFAKAGLGRAASRGVRSRREERWAEWPHSAGRRDLPVAVEGA